MRRRRQVLQVQTFPFLAVLLCTMGSLILLLLVIDRRARAVARARAEQAARKAAAAEAKTTAAAAAARQAEWERKRRQLHALLAQQEDDLAGKIRTVEAQATAAAGKLKGERDRYADLRRRLDAAEAGLHRDRQDLEGRRTEARQAAEKRARQLAEMKESAKREAARLAEELDQFEQVLAGLRALKRQEEKTYSVVPFFGRRGENRRPLYVECSRGSVIFHPDRLTLTGAALSPLGIRNELDRRLKGPPGRGPKAAPYLLLLVRPDGISSYYMMQTALAGLHIDFGYELIDQEWVLDFANEKQMAQLSPWKNGGKGSESPANAGQLAVGGNWPGNGRGLPGGAPGPGGGPALAGMASGSSRPAFGGLGGPGGGGGGLPPPPSAVAMLPSVAGGGAPFGGGPVAFHAIPSPPGSGPGPGTGYGGSRSGSGLGYGGGGGGQQPAGAGLGPLVARPGTPSGMAGMGPGGSSVGSGMAGPGGSFARLGQPPPIGLPGFAAGGPAPGGSGGSSWTGLAAPGGGSSPGPVAVSPPGLAGAPGQPGAPPSAGPLAGGATLLPPTAAGGNPGQPGQPVSPGSSSSAASLLPPLMPGLPGQVSQPASAGAPGQPSAGGSGQASGIPMPGGNGAQDAAGSAPPGTQDRPAYAALLAAEPSRSRRAALPLGHLIANRDWSIPIDCKADEVVVLSTGQRFPVAALRLSADLHHPLVEGVRGLIERRQATVSPGEPPYRPVLRFRVYPDGLRSYYAANALLSPLRLPAARDNLETERPALPDPFRP